MALPRGPFETGGFGDQPSLPPILVQSHIHNNKLRVRCDRGISFTARFGIQKLRCWEGRSGSWATHVSGLRVAGRQWEDWLEYGKPVSKFWREHLATSFGMVTSFGTATLPTSLTDMSKYANFKRRLPGITGHFGGACERQRSRRPDRLPIGTVGRWQESQRSLAFNRTGIQQYELQTQEINSS